MNEDVKVLETLDKHMETVAEHLYFLESHALYVARNNDDVSDVVKSKAEDVLNSISGVRGMLSQHLDETFDIHFMVR